MESERVAEPAGEQTPQTDNGSVAVASQPQRAPLLRTVAETFRLGVGSARDTATRFRGRAEWLIPLGVILLAALTRFIALGHPQALVFDETYYVKDGWSIWHLGYEGSWPENANAAFANGDPNTFTPNGTRVVHPPLGKWIIGLGMWLFGAQDAFGWRFATALLGVGTVLLTYLIARRLTGSAYWAGLAGLFLALDGLSITMSRVGLLDGVLTFFVVLGVLFLVIDHRGTMARIARDRSDLLAGPILWRRPWVIAAGAALGAATAVKWSGLYVLAGFGVWLVLTDMWQRRRAGVTMWFASSVGRQAPATFLLFVPVACVVYLTSWTGWLVTTGGYSRDSSPNPFLALLNYHVDSYNFHIGMNSPHSYASPAWQWPLLIRPTSMYWSKDEPTGMVQAITSIPNPILWWATCAAALALIVLFVLLRNWRVGVVLTALATTYVPWLFVPDRTIFMFYAVIMMPFLVIGLVLMMQQLAGNVDQRRGERPTRVQAPWRIGVLVFTLLVVAVSLFYLPLWTAMPVPYWFWHLHMWIVTWI